MEFIHDDFEVTDEMIYATKGSIKKWADIIAYEERDKGSGNCELCRIVCDDCSECVIYFKIDDTGCDSTPYEDWIRLIIDYNQNKPEINVGLMDIHNEKYRIEAEKHAINELMFLTDLLNALLNKRKKDNNF